jgi:hypothetical protein
MPITFQRCYVYNKVFFRNLNKLAFCPPISFLSPMGLLAFSKSWVVVEQNRLTNLLIIHSLIDHLSGGFESFVKQIVVPRMIHSITQIVYSSPTAFDFAFLLSYHLKRLMCSSGRYKSGILISCHVAKSKTRP